MPLDDHPDGYFVDANGRPAEVHFGDEFDLIVHYDDIPESDITIVGGIRCATALRTVIDIAAEYGPEQLPHVLRHCFDRRLFSARDARDRIARPDLRTHPGATLVAQALDRLDGPGPR